MTNARWHQRLNSFSSALSQLEEAVSISKNKGLSKLEKQRHVQITGSRDATREGFKMGLIEEGNIWMKMIKSRSQISPTYNEVVATDSVDRVVGQYFFSF